MKIRTILTISIAIIIGLIIIAKLFPFYVAIAAFIGLIIGIIIGCCLRPKEERYKSF